MITLVNRRSRVETILATVAAIVVVAFSFLAYFTVVGVALLYAVGVKLPKPTFLATGIIFFVIGAHGTLFLLSAAFLLWYLCRRRVARSESYLRDYPDYRNVKYPRQPPLGSSSHAPPKSLTSFAGDFEMYANLDSLTPLLCKQGLIHLCEMEGFLQAKLVSSRSFQMLHLLTLLDKRGRAGVEGVIRALRDDSDHIGHMELADTLTKAYPHCACGDAGHKSKYNRSQSCA